MQEKCNISWETEHSILDRPYNITPRRTLSKLPKLSFDISPATKCIVISLPLGAVATYVRASSLVVAILERERNREDVRLSRRIDVHFM